MLNYSLNNVISIAKVSKQALQQHNKRDILFTTRLSNLILEVDQLRLEHPGCGLEKIYKTLQPTWIGRDRFIDTLMDLGYRVRIIKNYTHTTIPGYFQYPNLIEGMILFSTDMLWQTDITYYPCSSIFFYIIFITDVFSRRILGYQASDHLRAQANIQALHNAFNQRKKDLTNLIHHSDHGAQYIDNEYTGMLLDKNINISMGFKAQDNAYAERVNGIIKNEYLKYWKINNLNDLRRKLKRAVNHYNNNRIHNSLPGDLSPCQFEENYINLTNDETLCEFIYAKNSSNRKKRGITLFSVGRDTTKKEIMCPIKIDC